MQDSSTRWAHPRAIVVILKGLFYIVNVYIR
jgi:hypothetical protein